MSPTSHKALSILMLLALACSGCLQTENSNSKDASLYQGLPPTSDEAFAGVQSLLQTKCSNCHDYHSMTADELVAAGLAVTGGIPEDSKIFYRLKNSSGALGPKNMPLIGTPTESELQTVYDWLTGL